MVDEPALQQWNNECKSESSNIVDRRVNHGQLLFSRTVSGCEVAQREFPIAEGGSVIVLKIMIKLTTETTAKQKKAGVVVCKFGSLQRS